MTSLPPSNGATGRAGDLTSLAASASVAVVGRGIGRLLHLATGVLVARALGPSAYGAYALAWTVTRFAAIAGTLGLELGVIKEGAEHRADPVRKRAVDRAGARAAVVASSAVALALVLSAAALGDRWFDDEDTVHAIFLVAPTIPFMSALVVMAAAQRVGTRGVRATLVEDVLQPALGVAGTLALLLGSAASVGTTSLALGASFVLAAVVAASAARREVASAPPPKVALAPLLAFSLAAGAPARLAYLLQWSDRVVVGALAGTEAAGHYQAASQCSMFFPIVLSGVTAAVSPLFAGLSGGAGAERRAKVFSATVRWSLAVCMPGLVLGLVAPADVLAVLFGEPFVAAAGALRVLIAGQVVNVATGALAPLLVMSGRQRAWLAVSAVLVVANVAGSVALVPRLGILGAAVATGGATLALNAAGMVLARGVGAGTPGLRAVLGMSLLYGAGFGVASAVVALTSSPLLRVGGILVATGLLVAAALLRAARSPGSDEALLIARLRASSR